MQSNKASMIEATTNMVLGFIISVLITIAIYGKSYQSAVGFVSVFTVVSIIRNYVIRRAFNYMHTKGVLQ